jgi:hypothetical protein
MYTYYSLLVIESTVIELLEIVVSYEFVFKSKYFLLVIEPIVCYMFKWYLEIAL